MPSDIEKSQAKAFISQIFKIVGESLSSAKLNNQEINNLSKNEQNQSVDSLFEKLALKIQGDSDAINTIYSNLGNYQKRIREALESTQIVIPPSAWPPKK
jgi:hypothetical protein